MQPEFNFNFTASSFIFISSVAFAFYTHVGWWALGGMAFLAYDKFNIAWLKMSFFVLAITLYIVASFNMGWFF